MTSSPRTRAVRPGPSDRRATGAGVLVIAVLGVVSVVGVVVALVTRQDPVEVSREVRAAVEVWSEAIDERDCDAYESVTMRDFRRQAEGGGDYDCQSWREAESGAATWTDIVLEDVAQVRGDRASVVVDATYVAEYAEDDFIDSRDIRAEIELQEQDGAWVLTEVEFAER